MKLEINQHDSPLLPVLCLEREKRFKAKSEGFVVYSSIVKYIYLHSQLVFMCIKCYLLLFLLLEASKAGDGLH